MNFMQQRPPNNGFHFKLRCPFQFSVNSLNITIQNIVIVGISCYCQYPSITKRMEIYAVQLTQLSECKRKSMIFYNGFIVIFTARKRSFGQGNIFTSVVIPSVNGGGGWLPSMHHRSHDQGVCIQGVCIWGHVEDQNYVEFID